MRSRSSSPPSFRTRVDPLMSRILVLALLSTAFGLQTACRTTEAPPAAAPIAVAGSPEAWAQLHAGQSARLERLARFTARGSVLVDFTDDTGARLAERAEHRFWREAPDRAAVRLSKAGVGLSMTAWNGDRWWIMDESGDDVVLEIHDLGPDAGRTLLAPPLLVAMAGLSPYPEAMPADFVRIGETYRFTMPEPGVDGGPSNAVLEVTTENPRRGPRTIVRLSSGTAPVRSSLTRFDSVEGRGRPPGDWALMPGRIEVERNDGEDRMVITLDRPLADGEISSRLFDLEAQIARSRPSVVRGRDLP